MRMQSVRNLLLAATFGFAQEGLMAGIGIQGTKISKIDPR